MFGHRTPVLKINSAEKRQSDSQSQEAEQMQASSVRRSIGEWEAAKPSQSSSNPSPRAALVAPAAPGKVSSQLVTQGPTGEGKTITAASPKPKPKYKDRTSEAKACLTSAKLHLNNSRNLKTAIKVGMTQAVERLYELVKEAEAAKVQPQADPPSAPVTQGEESSHVNIIKAMETHANQLRETEESMKELKESLNRHSGMLESQAGPDMAGLHSKIEELRQITIDESRKQAQDLQKVVESNTTQAFTYAEMARRPLSASHHNKVHSLIVSSPDEAETSSQVLEKIRSAVDAKNTGIQVEKIRKAKDQKVIISCNSKDEVLKVASRLKQGSSLRYEEATHKDPLIILKGVLKVNSDEDMVRAVTIQNKHLLDGLKASEIRASVKYRKKARNTHVDNIIMQVSPQVWLRLTKAEKIHVDLQRITVADQSPLVQCSLCLGYGHGRSFCKEEVTKCSHCGGPHMWIDCPDRIVGEQPQCCNCISGKIEPHNHNAFSQDCPVRRRWDALARASVAYC